MNSSVDPSWTVYESVVCECIGAKIAWPNINGVKKPTVILELADINNGKLIIRWLNLNKTSKSISASHNGDFAKLYRLTTGENPIPRYSKPDQLMKHLVSHLFKTEYENARHSNGEAYLKSTKISPVNPIVGDDWLSSGFLKGKQRGRYKPNRSDDNSKWKETGNDLEKDREKSGNRLERQNQDNASYSLASTGVSVPLKRIETKVELYTHAPPIPIPTDTEQYKTIVTRKGTETNYKCHRRPTETDAEYHCRVIDESMGF